MTEENTQEPIQETDVAEEVVSIPVEEVVEQVAPEPVKTATTGFIKPVDEVAKPFNSVLAEARSVIDKACALMSTGTAKITLEQIYEYMEKMKPKAPMSADIGMRHQILLYRTLMNVVNVVDDIDFKEAYSTVLKLFEIGKDDVFHEYHVYRFMDHIALSENDRKAFPRFLNLIKITAPVKGRAAAMRQVDLNKTMEFSFSEAARQRIMAYYSA